MEAKVFNDPVHGQVKIPPLCIKIIDTPQFQRLRRIKQLGGVYHVYYGASHNRFEHSIGVCYLAGKLLEHLQKEQEDLGIDHRDVLCVQVAALCHDLGHGPFSHVWQKSILPALAPGSKWTHEMGSVDMFNYLYEENHLEKDFKKHLKIGNGNDLEKELKFIRELIKGGDVWNGAWEMEGRKEDKAFLYEIVANEENGIDVDKWDYFARDCYHLGLTSSFDHWRLMNFARVLKVNDSNQVQHRQICYREKEASSVYGLFYTRNLLHQKAYQHKTVKAVECMIADAIVLSAGSIHFRTKSDGEKKPLSLSEIAKKMGASEKLDDKDVSALFQQLDDGIITRIMELEEGNDAKEILQRLEKRQIYRCFQSDPISDEVMKENKEKLKNAEVEIINIFYTDKTNPKDDQAVNTLEKDDLKIETVPYGFRKKKKETTSGKEGSGKDDPVDNVHFYTKSDPDTAIQIKKEKVSMMLPDAFSETRLILLYKKLLEDVEEDKQLAEKAKLCFEEFWKPFCSPACPRSCPSSCEREEASAN